MIREVVPGGGDNEREGRRFLGRGIKSTKGSIYGEHFELNL